MHFKLKTKNLKLKTFRPLFLCVLFTFTFLLLTSNLAKVSFAVSESDCLNKSASDLTTGEMDECLNIVLPRIAAAYAPAQEKNKQDLANLKSQLTSLNNRIVSISNELKLKEKEIRKHEEDMAFAQKILDEKARSQYIDSRLYDPVLSLISASDASEVFRRIKLREVVADEDRKVVEKYSQDLLSLKEQKVNLEKNKISLASLQKVVNEQTKFLQGEVDKVESFLSVLSSKQQEILAAKSGSFIASVGDSELADDYNASIKGFREAAPTGSFAVFSFGGYTHRKGMSQYGARGRAENGKNYRDILKIYYGKEPVGKDTGGTIGVAGYGNLNFEDYYLMGIAEMPSGWNIEALKAQAIAARTYAYRYKIEGKQICTSESCQVFRKSKADNPPDSWRRAVQETRGQVLEDVVTYYSSTTGGYITTLGWDTTDGGGGSNFLDKTYEKLGGSPWVYKAWYKNRSGNSCARGNPWLTNEDLTDIVNAAIVLKSGSDSRVTPVTTSCWGGNPYSYDELKAKGGVSSISAIFVSQGTGVTNEVTVNGTIHLTGSEFKQGFNLRAPGYLSVPQSGFAFFNIEKK